MAGRTDQGNSEKRRQRISQRPADSETSEQVSAGSPGESVLGRTLLSSVMEATGAQLAYLDRDFNFVMVNSAYARGCGYRAEELVGKNHFQLFPHEENRAIFEKVRGSGEPAEFRAKPFVFPHQPWRGTTYWDWTLAPVRDESGVTQGLVLSLTDATEREMARQALHAERDRLAAILDSMEDGVMIVGEDYSVQYANAALRAHFGEVNGRTCYEYLWRGEHVCPQCPTAGEPSSEAPCWHDYAFLDMSLVFEVVDTPLRNPDGSCSVVKLFRDVTDRKRMDQRVIDLERLAVMGRLSSGISHELRNPLATIDSSAYFLRSTLKDADAKVQTHLERIRASVGRCTEIIQSLVDLVKMKEVTLTEVDLKAVVTHALATVDVPETTAVTTELPDRMVVAGDWQLLELAFTKLIDNAVEAMEGQGKMTVSLSQTADRRAELSFADTGPGISPDNLSKVLEPFFSTKATGIGFGLPIAKMVIEKHGGTIEVKPSTPYGTNLVVRLPTQSDGAKEEDPDGRGKEGPGGGRQRGVS